MGDVGRVQPRSRRAWRAWLQKHHASSSGVWLVFAKRHTGLPSPTYPEAVEEALCFGWIDSLLKSIDHSYYMQMFTPRKAKSVWSAPNRARAAKMIAAGLMTPAGLRAIEVAKATGAWEALAHVEALAVPPELQRAIDASSAARTHWRSYTPGRRKLFLYWLNNAKRAETRAARIAEIVDRVARNDIPTMTTRRAKATATPPAPPPSTRATRSAPAPSRRRRPNSRAATARR